jgi:hypothetical protein
LLFFGIIFCVGVEREAFFFFFFFFKKKKNTVSCSSG